MLSIDWKNTLRRISGRDSASPDETDKSAESIHFLHLRQQGRRLDDLKVQTKIEVLWLNLCRVVRNVCVLGLIVEMDDRKIHRIERRCDQTRAGELSGLHLAERFGRIVIVCKGEVDELGQVQFVICAADVLE